MDFSTPPFDRAIGRRPADTVVPFARTGARRFRRDERDEAPRGQILLFTGVRYERLPEPVAEPSTRKRKRS